MLSCASPVVFFEAEDGIRDVAVTGVQTCALPIYDALGYFTARLEPAPTRAALAAVLHRAKRNKAFEDCRFVGLALDGTTGGRRRKKGCPLCRPHRNAQKEITRYRHHPEIGRAHV